MNNLAQIERVLFLQNVAPFSHCTSAQILRIAAIASEKRYAAGETIFEISDASEAIHCVVDGGVSLKNPSREQASVGPGEGAETEAGSSTSGPPGLLI